VRVDGHRVWTTVLDGRLEWPAALSPRLTGRARLALEDPETGVELLACDVAFDESSDRTQIVDRHGRWLAVNKWGNLIRTLEGADAAGLRARMLTNGTELVDLLRTWELEPLLIGGSLLGAVRDGALLPHDDDLDLTVVWEVDDAIEAVVAHRELERRLTEAGYTVVPHSHAHLQVTFRHDDGAVDHYIDIFATFLRGDVFSQPFPFRNRDLGRVDLLPGRPIVVEGVSMPGPARPEKWLAMAYGEGWRVPDPSFSFETPASTTRRFDGWFGAFNGGRDHWERHFEEAPFLDDVPRPDPALLESVRLKSASGAIDLGCGDGASTAMLAGLVDRVVGLDYSLEAMAAARSRSLAKARFEYWNANDELDVLELTARLLRSETRWLLHAGWLLHVIGREQRHRLLRMVSDCGADAALHASFDTELPPWFAVGDPSTWHLPVEVLAEEVAEIGLDMSVVAGGVRSTAEGERAWAAARIVAPAR